MGFKAAASRHILKLVLEVAGTSLVKIEHCKSQRLVLSAKGKEQLNTSLWNLQVRFYYTAVTIKGNMFRSCDYQLTSTGS